MSSSRGSSLPRDPTCVSYVSCFGFTTSAAWEAPECSLAGTKSDKGEVEHFEDGFTDPDEAPQTPSQQTSPSLINFKKIFVRLHVYFL